MCHRVTMLLNASHFAPAGSSCSAEFFTLLSAAFSLGLVSPHFWTFHALVHDWCTRSCIENTEHMLDLVSKCQPNITSTCTTPAIDPGVTESFLFSFSGSVLVKPLSPGAMVSNWQDNICAYCTATSSHFDCDVPVLVWHLNTISSR